MAYATGISEHADSVAGPQARWKKTGVPTEIALQSLSSADWPTQPEGSAQVLYILSATHWESVFHRLRKMLTPQQPGTGAVIDILQLEEWFSYYDDAGRLQWVLIEDKPAGIRVKYSYSFAQVLEVLRSVLADYLASHGITGRQVLLVEAEHVTVEIRLILESLIGDDVGHGNERRSVGRRPDEDVLIRQLVARARDPRIDTDHAHAVLLGPLEIL